MSEKVCVHCCVIKPLKDFRVNQTSRKPNARVPRCYDCERQYYKDRYQNRKASK